MIKNLVKFNFQIQQVLHINIPQSPDSVPNFECGKNKIFSNFVYVFCYGLFHPGCIGKTVYQLHESCKMYCFAKYEQLNIVKMNVLCNRSWEERKILGFCRKTW